MASKGGAQPALTAKPPAHETSAARMGDKAKPVFLDSNRWVVELTVKGSNLHLAPQYSVRGDGQFDKPKLAAV